MSNLKNIIAGFRPPLMMIRIGSNLNKPGNPNCIDLDDRKPRTMSKKIHRPVLNTMAWNTSLIADQPVCVKLNK